LESKLAHRSEFTLFSPEEKLLYEQAKVVLLNRKVGHGWLSLVPQGPEPINLEELYAAETGKKQKDDF